MFAGFLGEFYNLVFISFVGEGMKSSWSRRNKLINNKGGDYTLKYRRRRKELRYRVRNNDRNWTRHALP